MGRVWGGTRWRVAAAILAMPLALVAVMIWSAGEEWDEHTAISCTAAMTFAHGTLPDSATDEDCESVYWQEYRVDGTFRMDRADVERWVKAEYPQLKPVQECDDDLCLAHSFGTSELADSVRLSFRYEHGQTVRVTLHAMQS